MKTKYERMSKEEKKKLIEKYSKDPKGSSLLKRLTRIKITGIICLLFSIGLIINSLFNFNIVDYLIIVPLFLAAMLFLIMSYKLKKKVLTRFAVKGK